MNGKKYVGITTSVKGFNGRYKGRGKGIERTYNHMSSYKRGDLYFNQHLFRSIEKYGFDNFTVNEEFDVAYSQMELMEKERYWIENFQSDKFDKGYNKSNGGEAIAGNLIAFETKLKRKTTKAKNTNFGLDVTFNYRKSLDNPYYLIWDTADGLNKLEKSLLCHKLQGGKTKFCKICGIEYYRSGKGDYCKSCGEEDFKKEYKAFKKLLRKSDYKIEIK